ncbi:MAG: hypothetical protein ACREQX_04995 [Candidatus Binataceae bacterium]
MPVFVTNLSRFDVSFDSISTSGAPFSLHNNRCRGTLKPLRSCSLLVEFSPTRNGHYDGVVTFADSAEGDPQTVSLHGITVTRHLGDHNRR